MRKNLNFQHIAWWIIPSILLASILVVPSPTSAQEPNRVDKEAWEDAIEGIDYGTLEQEEKDEGEEEEEDSFTDEVKDDNPSSWNWDIGINPTFLKVLSISLIVILLTFILVKLLGHRVGFGKLKQKKLSFSLEDVEEHLEETDLERFKREALEKKDFKTAIRILYLMILKDLSLQGKIEWKREKTNSQYVREMRGKEGFREFRDLTRSFEYVWYGEAPISASDYQKLLPTFSNFLDVLEQQNNSNEKR